MLLPIKPVCKRNKTRRDGTCIIFIQYCHTSERRTLLNTQIAVPPVYWKRSRISIDLPENYGNAEQLNARIRAMVRIAEDIISYAVKKKLSDPLTFLREIFHPDFDSATLEETRLDIPEILPETNLNLFFQIDDYIKSKEKKVVPDTLRVFKDMKDHLEAYEKYRGVPIAFDSFDFDFYEKFVDFLTYEYVQRRRKALVKGMKNNTIGKTIKQLRVFLRDRMRRKIIAPIDLTDFKILDEESDAVYLTRNEIGRIYQTDLSEFPHLVKCRDMFVLGCLTGLRFSDFSKIRSEDIRSDMLHKKQDKSDHWVVIPLRNAAEDILINRFDRQIPITSNPEFNRYIKDVAKLAGICELVKFSFKRGNKDIVVVKPKYAWVTSHTCRRSFCTNEFLAGTPAELIMKISGHKSLRDFYRYIRITPEEAGRKIREIWEKRGEMNTLQAKAMQQTNMS